MDDLTEIDNVLDVNSLTAWELVLAVIVLLATAFASRLARRGVRSVLESRESVEPHLPEFIGRMVGWAVWLIGIVLALIIVGIQMGPVVLLLLIFAVMAFISGRRVLENFAAGLSLQLTTPFVVGDRIETSHVTGWVEAVTARAVVLTTRDRRRAYVPNSMVIDDVLYNYTDDDWRRSEVAFAVAYGYEMRPIRDSIDAAVAALEVIHDEPAPVTYIDELTDDGVAMKARFYHADSDRIAARDQVAETIMTTLAQAGIETPTPAIAIHNADPSRP